jgi:hypothetical protein
MPSLAIGSPRGLSPPLAWGTDEGLANEWPEVSGPRRMMPPRSENHGPASQVLAAGLRKAHRIPRPITIKSSTSLGAVGRSSVCSLC